MNFIKNFFNHDNVIVGLSGLRKREEYVKITIPEHYKKSFVQNPLSSPFFPYYHFYFHRLIKICQ